MSKAISLKGGSYLSVSDAHFLMQDKGKVLAFKVAITNNGSRTLDLMDYFLRVKTTTGKLFKAVPIEADKNKVTVPAKTTQTITYYAVVDQQTQLKDLIFQVVQWDLNATSTNYERQLGTIQFPANAANQVAPFVGSTMLYNNGKVRGAVKQTFISMDSKEAYLTINFLLENVGMQSVDVSKMNFLVQTESLSVYDVVPSDFEQMVIQPKERKIVSMHATLPLAVANKPLSVVVAQNDETSQVKLPIGLFKLPATKPAPVTGVGQTRLLYLKGAPVNTASGSAFVTPGSGNNEVSITFDMMNTGATSIAAPAMEFFLVTASGTNYPLTYTKEENEKLLPNIKKSIALTGSIPSSVKLETSQLLVKTAATEKEKSHTLGKYKLQSTSQQGSVGSSFKYNDYDVKLSSVERAPFEDNDMLVANLVITNKSSSSKKVPDLSGYFMVNGVKVGTEQRAVPLDSSVTIAPGAAFEYVVYSEIPYNTAVDKISFVATEPVQDKPGKQLYQFSGQKLGEMKLNRSNESYVIKNIGKKAEVKVLRTGIFAGELKNNFYGEFEFINQEARAAFLAKLGGYIQDKNGVIVPVKFSEVKDKITPGGKVLVSAWAPISQNFDSTSYKLIMGQALTSNAGNGSEGSGNENVPTKIAVVKPVYYALSTNTEQPVKKDFKDIKFAGYSLDLSKVRNSLDVSGQSFSVNGVKMTMDYTLAKDKQYESIAGDHKLMFEFISGDIGNAKYTTQFSLMTAGENEKLLKEATNAPLSFVFEDNEVQMKVQKYENYTLNIYDVFQNTKLLIASKELKWFTASE
ncbi:hypothetical protein [Paenibacillus sp. GCM10027626]|uniref:hypothetical protein n=1 Tax=Paenibacillus sp. GCM10027626 TaxID=3273411 RepID=UPI003624B604